MSNNQFFKWMRELLAWLCEAKTMISFLLVTGVAVYLGLCVFGSEASIRISGYFLQLIGMLFALRGLLSLRVYFNQISFRELIINWIKRFPKYNRVAVITAMGSSAGSANMKARLEVWQLDDSAKPIEERLQMLVNNLDRIREEVRQHNSDIDKLKLDHIGLDKKSKDGDLKVIEDIRKDLEALHTGDLTASFCGLVILTVGITLSTLSQEIVKWL